MIQNTSFQDQTFIGMGVRVCLDVTGMVQSDNDVVLAVGDYVVWRILE